jgi:hypothetical protein
MKFSRIAAACAACVLNAAFAAPAVPAAPAPAELMMQAFPGWSLHPASHVQTVTLPHMPGLSREPGLAVWSEGLNRVLAEPRLTLRLDATHLTLIAGLVPATENGKPAVSHVLPMAIAAYQFERRGGSWQLTTRQGVFAMRGFFGEASLRAVELSDRRQALAVEYGSCWQGYCGTWMALYALDKGAMRQEPAVEMALSGINVDSTGDCMRRLQPLIKPHPQESHPDDDKVPGDSHDCYAIESSWTVEPSREQPGDLVIRYQGAMSRAQTYAAPPSAIDQRQVLRYKDGKYRAISGFNPVPPI